MRTVEKHVPVTSEKERYRMVDDANAQLLTLRLREQQLLEKYTEDNRLVVNIRKEIAVLEGFLKTQKEDQTQKVVTGKNPVYEEMEKEMVTAQADLASLASRRASLKGQIALLDRELQTFDSTGTTLETLKREVDLNYEERPDLLGACGRGAHLRSHEPAEDGERHRHPAGHRPHRAHQAPPGLQLPARPRPRLHIGARLRLLLGIYRPEPVHPPDRGETAAASRPGEHTE